MRKLKQSFSFKKPDLIDKIQMNIDKKNFIIQKSRFEQEKLNSKFQLAKGST